MIGKCARQLRSPEDANKHKIQTYVYLRPPGIDIGVLEEKVNKAGYTVTRSTVLTLRATVLDTVRVMHAIKLTSIPTIPARDKPKPKPKPKAKVKTEKAAA